MRIRSTRALALGALGMGLSTLLVGACSSNDAAPTPSSGRPPAIASNAEVASAIVSDVARPFDPRSIRRVKKADRDRWHLEQRAYPGRLPDRAYAQATEEWSRARALSADTAAAASSTTTAWTLAGPAAIDPAANAFLPNAGPTSGRVTSIAIHPTNPKVIWMGAASGGVWKTTDGGVTWKPLTDAMPTLVTGVGSIAIDPNDPDNTVYVGTGEGDAGGSIGAGIFKTIDGGKSWKVLGATTFANMAFSRVVIHKETATTSTIYASTRPGLTGSYDTCTPAAVANSANWGFWKSTDGGATWTHLFNGTGSGASVTDFVLDPGASPQFAILNWRNHGGFKVSLITAGSSTPIPTLPPEASAVGGKHISWLSFARAPNDASTLYAGAEMLSTDGLETSLGGTLYRSKDNGVTWAEMVGAPNFCKDQCGYDDAIAVDPANKDLGYFGGASCPVWQFTSGTGTPAYTAVSKDDRVCNANEDNWWLGFVHPDLHAIVFDPNDATGKTVYFGSDGGVSRTIDGGTTFTRLNLTIATNQFYHVCVDPGATYRIAGGTQDNGVALNSANGSTLVWKQIGGGDGAACSLDLDDATSAQFYNATSQFGNLVHCDRTQPNDPNVCYTDDAGFVCCGTFSVSQPRDVRHIDLVPTAVDSGVADSAIADSGFDAADADTGPLGDRSSFIPPLVTDPSDRKTLYLGTFRVWQSKDGGRTWGTISADLTLGAAAVSTCTDLNGGADVLQAIAVSPGDPKRLYATSYFGEITTTSDGGKSWTRIDKGPLPVRVPTAISVAPGDGKTVYVTYGGFSANTSAARGHVFRSLDAGVTWTRADASIDTMDLPFNDVMVHPLLGNVVYAATDLGVVVTTDSGASWKTMGTGLPNVESYALAFHVPTSRIAIGTYGRSVWDARLVPSIVTTAASLTFNAVAGATPAPQTLGVNDGEVDGSVLHYAATVLGASAWLAVGTPKGTIAGAMQGQMAISVSTAGLTVGPHTDTIRIADPNASPDHVDVLVTVNVTQATDGGAPDAGSDGGGGGGGDGGGDGAAPDAAPEGGNGAPDAGTDAGTDGSTGGDGGADAGPTAIDAGTDAAPGAVDSGVRPPPHDAGVADASDASTAGGGTGDNGGCGCVVPGSRSRAPARGSALALALGLVALVRRRKRGHSTTR